MLRRLRNYLAAPANDDLRDTLDRFNRELEALRRQYKLENKWRGRIVQKLDALLRTEYLEFASDEFPEALTAKRFSLYSQSEEDGMVLALLRLVKPVSRRFVEIGCGRTGGNSAMLAAEFGWSGLMVDSEAGRVSECQNRFSGNPGVLIAEERVTESNVNDLVAGHGFAGEVDLFSLDIDSHDYWVFKSMTACSARIVILEYNAYFGPETSVTIPAGAPVDDTFKGYHGASLAAMNKAAEEKGYRLLACDLSGTNAFFLRNDIRPEIPPVPVGRAFRPAQSRYDPLGEQLKGPIDVVSRAREVGLPLEYV